MKLPWAEKYRPKKYSDIIGQEDAILKAKEYLEKFPKVKKRALLLYGSPGVGKTTLTQVMANETGSEIFEMNASDLRNKASMKQALKPVLEQTSLFKKNKIILIDEVDGVSGTKDRGGLSELISLLTSSPYPIICTANDVWSKKLDSLRKKCQIIELKEISPSQTKQLLKKILETEKKHLTLKTLNQIAINSKGDLRSAINDLESASQMQTPEEFTIDQRNKKLTIFQALQEVFQEYPSKETLKIFDKTNMNLDEIMLWIEENIPKAYNKDQIPKAINALCNADLFKGRIYKKQYWRFLVYQNIFLSYAISEAKQNSKNKFAQFTKPERILKIWLNNMKNSKRKTIAIKYAKATHIGQKRALSEWREIKAILKNKQIQQELKLEEDEITYIEKY